MISLNEDYITPKRFWVFPMPMIGKTTEAGIYEYLDASSKHFVKLSLDDYEWWFEIRDK